MTADLHIHTSASDGLCPPEMIYTMAALAGLQVIALTDHDTVDGYLALKDTPLPPGPEIIPGIEFNTETDKLEIHILGYYFDLKHSGLLATLNKLRESRAGRAKRMVEKLNSLGYHISFARVAEIARDSCAIGRPHIAVALAEKHYVVSPEEAFATILSKQSPAYVPHYKLMPDDAVRLIRRAGGIPVLAHPGLIGDDSVIRDLLPVGLMGLEVYHPKHDGETAERYAQMAREYGLLVTGGSDYHGGHIRFPAHLGQFTVPATLAAALRRARFYRDTHETPAY